MLLKAILAGDDPQVLAVVDTIATVHPDILLLTGFDQDYALLALSAFQAALARAGITYDYAFAPAGNAGRPSGRDLDGDGRVNGWRDALGFGRFPGNGAMALLSRYPLGDARSFTKFPWQDGLPLASHGFWDVNVQAPGGDFRLLALHATPPVFDGPDDRNGRRNAAELRFWYRYLSGVPVADDAGRTAPFAGGGFVLLGDFNNDPVRGEGLKPDLRALLAHPALQDPPQLADLATVEWAGVGEMRVDYVLPSRMFRVVDTGVYRADAASNHRLVRVDIAR